jgi:hypothetical protein
LRFSLGDVCPPGALDVVTVAVEFRARDFSDPMRPMQVLREQGQV